MKKNAYRAPYIFGIFGWFWLADWLACWCCWLCLDIGCKNNMKSFHCFSMTKMATPRSSSSPSSFWVMIKILVFFVLFWELATHMLGHKSSGTNLTLILFSFFIIGYIPGFSFAAFACLWCILVFWFSVIFLFFICFSFFFKWKTT